jgi:hypothetical protein
MQTSFESFASRRLEKLGTPPATDAAEPSADAVVTSESSIRLNQAVISEADRVLSSANNADSGVSKPKFARTERIREMVLLGAYNTMEVVDAMARRLLDSGDI